MGQLVFDFSHLTFTLVEDTDSAEQLAGAGGGPAVQIQTKFIYRMHNVYQIILPLSISDFCTHLYKLKHSIRPRFTVCHEMWLNFLHDYSTVIIHEVHII